MTTPPTSPPPTRPPLSSRLSIAPATGKPTLSPAQKKFNALIRKIEAERKLLADWQLAIPLYRQKRASDFMPMMASYQAQRLALAKFLDQAASQKGLASTERDTLSDIVCELVADLMDSTEQEELKALYNKHSTSDFDTEREQAHDQMRAMLKEELGVELGDDVDMGSRDAVLQRLQQQLREAQEAQAAEADAQAAPRKAPKKSTRQLKQEAEQQQVSQSLREVYRKLASALHPDRETDPQEVERKTALMKRVNQAYANKNLLDLLTLQLEVEQIDPQGILSLGDDRLRRYNQILTEQLAELQQETQGTEIAFKTELGVPPYALLAPVGLLRELKAQVRDLRDDIDGLKTQLRELGDPKALKRWLKQQRAQSSTPDDLLALLRRGH